MIQNNLKLKHAKIIMHEFAVIANNCKYKLKDGVYVMDCESEGQVAVDIDAPPAFKG